MIVVIDTKLVAYYLHHRKEPLSNIMSTVARILSYNNINPSKIKKIIWAMDNKKKGNDRRRLLYPAYKGHRKDLKKKLSASEQRRLKKFEELYHRLEAILPFYGTVLSIGGLEADDVANIIVNRLADKHEILLVSSDRDWGFNYTLTDTPENVKIIHLSRGLITHRNAGEVYGMPVECLLPLQVYAGIAKENVSGIIKLGPKTFTGYWKLAKGDEEVMRSLLAKDLKRGKYGMKLPEDVGSMSELIDRNYEILRPTLMGDLTPDQQQHFLDEFKVKQRKDMEEYISTWVDMFMRPPVVSHEVSRYFGVTSPLTN